MDPSAIAGSSGWLGAGLLGLVLAWLLLKHLPDKDKQLLDLMMSKDTAVDRYMTYMTVTTDAVRKSNAESLDKVIAEFRNALLQERESCERNFKEVAAAVRDAVQSASHRPK